jgi:fatty acid desaturase
MRILHYGADVRSVAFVLLAVTVPAVQWAGVYRHPLLYACTFPLAFIACVINHNHQHHPTFVPRRLNHLFGVLLSLAMGFPATAIVAMHNHNHHIHNNHAEDYVRASIVGFRWNFLNLLLFPVVALAHYAPVKSRQLTGWRTEHPALYRQLWRERWTLYPSLILILILRPLETLLYFVLPWLYGQWGLLAINHVQHDGCDPDSEYNHSRNFVGRWLNWWVFNNGYHTAHHLRPGLHWSLLPVLHQEILPHLDPALDRRSLAVTVFQFYLWPGRRPTAKGVRV